MHFINRPVHPTTRHRVAVLPLNQEAATNAEPMELEDPLLETVIHNQTHAPIAKLSKCPRTLHELWREYEFGIAGYKAAKDFTEKERGQDKCKYYRRNVFWRKVKELVLAGCSANEACDLIYRSYGQSCSVTKILSYMIRDKKIGGHPGLAIGAR